MTKMMVGLAGVVAVVFAAVTMPAVAARGQRGASFEYLRITP
jgi:hypothetical protein